MVSRPSEAQDQLSQYPHPAKDPTSPEEDDEELRNLGGVAVSIKGPFRGLRSLLYHMTKPQLPTLR